VDRINLPNLLDEVSESVFQVNKGFFFTIKELFIQPGLSIKEFLNGKRKDHFKPIAYVLTLSTLYFLISRITHQNTWMDDLIQGFTSAESDYNSGIQVPAILTWFSKNFAYSALILLPIFSLTSYLMFFKFRLNYLEHIVINSYITGQQAIFYTLFAILETVVKNKAIDIILFIATLSYTCWVFVQLFPKGKAVMNILRTILTYVLYMILSFGLLFTISWSKWFSN
jgi:hypothetical protein